MGQIEFKEYFAIIFKRLWIIVLAAFLFTLGSAAITYYVRDRIYEASTTLYVGKHLNVSAEVEAAELNLGENLIRDYGELVKTKMVAREVIAELQDEIPWLKQAPESYIAGKISVNAINGSRFIQLKVTDLDPKTAAMLANTVAEVFQRETMKLLRIENIAIIDKAEVPSIPVKPQHKMDIAVGFAAGILVGLLFVFLLEYLDDTYKTPEDISRHLGLNVVGIIPKVNKRAIIPEGGLGA